MEEVEKRDGVLKDRQIEIANLREAFVVKLDACTVTARPLTRHTATPHSKETRFVWPGWAIGSGRVNNVTQARVMADSQCWFVGDGAHLDILYHPYSRHFRLVVVLFSLAYLGGSWVGTWRLLDRVIAG